jgi:hypothetical protein
MLENWTQSQLLANLGPSDPTLGKTGIELILLKKL